MRVRPLPLALLVLALLIPEGAAAESPTRIIVKREPGLSAAERADIRADAGVRLVEPLPLPRTEVVAAPAGEVGDALRDLRADEGVVYAELDRPVHALASDEFFHLLWGLHNVGQPLLAGHSGTEDADMDVLEAWQLSTGSGQTVAVVDTGVDATHPDLVGQVAGGHDWVDDDADPNDANGHGTHVAGTIAATRDNGEGIAGVAPDATIMPLRVLNASGSGSTSDVAAAFVHAGEQGVRIVNASLGSDSFSTTERNAIAAHPETLYVVAAGNGGPDEVGDDNDGANSEYPCAYDLPNIVCVGASDPHDAKADFSNFGAQSVDLFAPGVEIVSTELGTYFVEDGTSMASPHVAGTAALVRAHDASMSAAEIKAAILQSVDPIPAFSGLSVTGGRANAARAVSAAPDVEVLDVDGDGVVIGDNCRARFNPSQVDADLDGAGDACDATPRGRDLDGDGSAALDDRCPTVYGTAADGCPVPGPIVKAPSLTSLSAEVSRCRAGRRCNRSVKLTVRADRPATVKIKLERKKCKRHRCRWVRVTRRTASASNGSVRVKISRLRKGSHRATVTLSNGVGASKPRTRRFTVR